MVAILCGCEIGPNVIYRGNVCDWLTVIVTSPLIAVSLTILLTSESLSCLL